MLVGTAKFQPKFFMPFFYMRSESFWNLVPMPGNEEAYSSMKDARSLGQLRNAVAFAAIDTELMDLLLAPVSREQIRRAILTTYFAETAENYLRDEPVLSTFIEDIEKSILHEPQPRYRKKPATDPDEYELMRWRYFPGVVTREYRFTCSISGMNVRAGKAQLVDACHIIPFNRSNAQNYAGINSITNAITLCPNLHKAFDNHLLAISDDYRVLIKREFSEKNSDYTIKQFENKQLLLPGNREYWPSRESLKWHREHLS